MKLKIFWCWPAFVFSPFLNFLFTSFACTSNVFTNSTNTYGVLLWTEMFVSPPNSCWNPKLQCCAIRRWGLWEVIRFRWGHETGAPMMGLVFLYKRKRLARAHYFLSARGYSKVTVICKARALTRHRIGQHLDLGLCSLQHWEK